MSLITVRPPQTSAEEHAIFRLAAETFASRDAPAAAARAWQHHIHEHPAFEPTWVRGAYQDDNYLGGYLIEERSLHLGGARLRTGCIGGVVTAPPHRQQGVATALMEDAIAYARSRNYAFLLLHGFVFYRRFGYVDVLDTSRYTIDRAQVLGLPDTTDIVRPAEASDAPALLDLYRRHFGPYSGSFDRTLAEQSHQLHFLTQLSRPEHQAGVSLVVGPPLVAVGRDGKPSGSLVFPWAPLRTFGVELAADTWPAALALVHYAARMDGQRVSREVEAPSTLVLPLIPDAPTFYLLADHLRLERHTTHQPFTGWMARLVDAAAVLHGMLPV